MTSNETVFSALMLKAQSGDGTAYQLLLQGLGDFLENYLKSKVKPEEVLEELIQEVLMAVHNSLASYDPRRSFMSWFLGIVHYKVVDHWRASGRQSRGQELLDAGFEMEPSDFFIDGLSSLEKREQNFILETLLGTLDRRSGEIVLLVKIDELKIEEVARKTGLSVANVKVILHRAMKTLSVKAKGDV